MATNAPRAQGKIMMVGSLPFEKRPGNRTDIRRIASSPQSGQPASMRPFGADNQAKNAEGPLHYRVRLELRGAISGYSEILGIVIAKGSRLRPEATGAKTSEGKGQRAAT